MEKLLHPLLALFLFNAVFSFYHIPLIHDTIRTHYVLHILMDVLLEITAFPMWWPVLCPVAWAKALGFCCTGTSAAQLLQQFSGPQYFSIMPPLMYQQASGVVMKIMQEFVYGTTLGFIFFRWYSDGEG